MILNKVGYGYEDLTIVPHKLTRVKSRSECDPYTIRDTLPIFASPMASVVSDKNYNSFIENGIIPIIPRNIDFEKRVKLMENGLWVALSLDEFSNLFCDFESSRYNTVDYYPDFRICIDIANGHMVQLYEKILMARQCELERPYNLVIMAGNMASPETYETLCEQNIRTMIEYHVKLVDYIRTSIGSGQGCTTSSNVGVHYPPGTLIDECRKIADKYEKYRPLIVADGGIKGYRYVNIALALGADYVMIGGLFSQTLESAGEKVVYIFDESPEDCPSNSLTEYEDLYCDFNTGDWYGTYKGVEVKLGKIDSKFFGMASADGQKSISGNKTKTAEGVTKYLPVKYRLDKWAENMAWFIRSAMSYCDSFYLEEFIGKQTLIPNSQSAVNAVNK